MILSISGYCAIKYTIPKWQKEMITNQHTITKQTRSSINETHQKQRENNQPITLTSKVVTQQFDNTGIANTNYNDEDIRDNQAYVANKVGHYLVRITNLKDYQVNIISNADYSKWGVVTNYSQLVYLTKKN